MPVIDEGQRRRSRSNDPANASLRPVWPFAVALALAALLGSLTVALQDRDGIFDVRDGAPRTDAFTGPRESSVRSADWHQALQVALGPVGPTPGQSLRRD